MADVAAENQRLLDAVSGLIEQAGNLRIEPLTDGTVGVIIRPLDCEALDAGS
jgi:hypothetical protein